MIRGATLRWRYGGTWKRLWAQHGWAAPHSHFEIASFLADFLSHEFEDLDLNHPYFCNIISPPICWLLSSEWSHEVISASTSCAPGKQLSRLRCGVELVKVVFATELKTGEVVIRSRLSSFRFSSTFCWLNSLHLSSLLCKGCGLNESICRRAASRSARHRCTSGDAERFSNRKKKDFYKLVPTLSLAKHSNESFVFWNSLAHGYRSGSHLSSSFRSPPFAPPLVNPSLVSLSRTFQSFRKYCRPIKSNPHGVLTIGVIAVKTRRPARNHVYGLNSGMALLIGNAGVVPVEQVA